MLSNIKLGLTPPEPTPIGWYTKRNIWNSVILIDGKNFRERCEALIIKDDKVLLSRFNNGNNNAVFCIPGGSTEKDRSIEEQVIEECREEVLINIKNPLYVGNYIKYYRVAHNKKIDDTKIVYSGKVCHLFVAEFDSNYKDYINPYNRDDKINKYSKFYDIDEVYDKLNFVYKKAIDIYRQQKKENIEG